MTVGAGPPDELQEMLVLPLSETITASLIVVAVFEFSKCA